MLNREFYYIPPQAKFKASARTRARDLTTTYVTAEGPLLNRIFDSLATQAIVIFAVGFAITKLAGMF